MDRRFVNFRVVYDDLTDEVERSRYTFLTDHLRNWFEALDETATVSTVVARLQDGQNFDEWLGERKNSVKGMVGSGDLVWPAGKDKRFGMKLLLFRKIATGELDAMDFCSHFLWIANDYESNSSALVEQLFSPTARELRRYLEKVVGEQPEIPASDRAVRLDHNSAAYKEAMDALETLERVLKEANDYPGEPEEQEQRVAEISAVRRLLQAPWVRVEPLVALVKPLLAQYGTAVKTGIIAIAAAATIAALRALVGL